MQKSAIFEATAKCPNDSPLKDEYEHYADYPFHADALDEDVAALRDAVNERLLPAWMESLDFVSRWRQVCVSETDYAEHATFADAVGESGGWNFRTRIYFDLACPLRTPGKALRALRGLFSLTGLWPRGACPSYCFILDGDENFKYDGYADAVVEERNRWSSAGEQIKAIRHDVKLLVGGKGWKNTKEKLSGMFTSVCDYLGSGESKASFGAYFPDKGELARCDVTPGMPGVSGPRVFVPKGRTLDVVYARSKIQFDVEGTLRIRRQIYSPDCTYLGNGMLKQVYAPDGAEVFIELLFTMNPGYFEQRTILIDFGGAEIDSATIWTDGSVVDEEDYLKEITRVEGAENVRRLEFKIIED